MRVPGTHATRALIKEQRRCGGTGRNRVARDVVCVKYQSISSKRFSAHDTKNSFINSIVGKVWRRRRGGEIERVVMMMVHSSAAMEYSSLQLSAVCDHFSFCVFIWTIVCLTCTMRNKVGQRWLFIVRIKPKFRSKNQWWSMEVSEGWNVLYCVIAFSNKCQFNFMNLFFSLHLV